MILLFFILLLQMLWNGCGTCRMSKSILGTLSSIYFNVFITSQSDVDSLNSPKYHTR